MTIRSLFSVGQSNQKQCACMCVRSYARGSNFLASDDGPSDRLPSRVKRRLEKHGMSVDDFLGRLGGTQQEIGRHSLGDISPPTSASAHFPQTDNELQSMLKDMKGGLSDAAGQPMPMEEFPSDLQKQQQAFRDQSRKAYRPRVDPSTTSIILFPGQGSQFVGMGKAVLDYGKSKDLFEEASAILNYDLLKLCTSGPIATLSKTAHCQPAVLVSSLAAVEKLKEHNPEAVETCVGTAGFSIGEFAALVFAGVLAFADAIEIVRVRAEAMQKASEEVHSGMLTTFLNHSSKLNMAMDAAREYCSQRCDIHEPVCRVANYLFPECKVIAGHNEALDFIETHAKTFGIRRTKRLPVSGAFHTVLMASAQQPLKEVIERVSLSDPQIPVYSNVTAAQLRRSRDIGKLLVKQVVAPVKWEQIMHVVYSRPQGEGFPSTFEVGPGNQLGLVLKLVNAKAHEKYTHIDV